MTIEVNAPDGSIVEFPDGTAPEVMKSAMRKRFGGPTAPPPAAVVAETPVTVPAAPAAPRSWKDAIMSGASTGGQLADRAVRGVAEGIATIVGAPADLIGAGLGAAGVKSPFGGSRVLKDALNSANNATADAIGVERPRIEPDGMIERGVQRVGQELGAALLPGAGMMGHAQKLGVEGVRQMGPLARMFFEHAAANPASFARKEAVAAAAAGAGAAGANETTRVMGIKEGSPAHNAGDLAGAMTGVGATALTGAIMRPLGNVLGAATGNMKFADRVIRDQVVDEVARAAGLPNERAIDTQPLVDTIMKGSKVSDTIPGYKDTLADRTANPGVAALEYSRSGGPSSGTYTQRRGDNVKAVDDAMTRLAPDGQPGALRDALDTERTNRLTGAATTTSAVKTTLDQHMQRLQPVMTGEGRGADIRAALENASEGANDIVRKAWEPLNTASHSVDMAPLANDFGRVGKNLSVAERERFQPAEADIPKRLSGERPVVPERLNADGTPVTEPITQPINEVTGLRNALTDAAREAGSAGRTNEARVINQHIDALDNYLDNTIPPELRQQYDAARSATKDFHDRFTRPQTAIAQTLDRREGLYRQPDSAVAGKFVQADEGRIADFQSLMKEAGNDARVVPAVRDQILADVRDRKLLDNPEALGQYIDRYNTVLSDPRFAPMRRELSTAEGLRGALDTASKAEAKLTRELGTPDKPGTSTVGKYLQYGDARAERAMSEVMAAKDPAKAADDLLSFVKDDAAAVGGARKAFWNLMETKARSSGRTTATISGVQPWWPDAMKKYLAEHKAVAERLYRDNPEHLADLNKLVDTLQGSNVALRAKAPNSSGTAQIGQSVLPSTETLASRAFAVQRGVVGIPFTVLNLAGIMARRATGKQQMAAFNTAMDKALLEPEWAAQLLKENNPANRAAMARTAKAYLGNQADTVLKLIADNDRTDDPTAESVMRGKNGR